MGASDIILLCLTGLSSIIGIIIGMMAFHVAKDYAKDQILPFGVHILFDSISSKKVQVGKTTKVKVALTDEFREESSDSPNKNCQPSFF